jgi:ABC-type amino acid transport substrate-binding protein
LAEIKSSGQFRVAGAPYPPFTIQNPDGSFDGFDIELEKAFASQFGVKLTVIPAGWDSVVAGLQTNKWDVVAGICNTPARAQVIDFTTAEFDAKLQFVSLVNNPKGVPQTFAGVNSSKWTVVVATGSAQAEYVKQVAPNATVKSIPGVTDADLVQQLLAGRADVLITTAPFTTQMIQNSYPGKFNFFPSDLSSLPSTCPQAWGIPKDAAFQAYLNKFFVTEHQNGDFDKLQTKYFGPAYMKLT